MREGARDGMTHQTPTRGHRTPEFRRILLRRGQQFGLHGRQQVVHHIAQGKGPEHEPHQADEPGDAMPLVSVVLAFMLGVGKLTFGHRKPRVNLVI